MAAKAQESALSADEVLAEVTRIVRDATAVGATRELPPDQPLVALGLDSLALVNAVAAVEAAFGSELPDALWEDRRGVSLASLAAAVASVAPSVPPVALAAAPVSSPSEQPGNSRVEPLFLRLEASGPAGRAAAGALQRAVSLAQWARARRPCVVLARDLTGELPDYPLPPGVTVAPYDGASDEPLAGIWTSTQAARSRARHAAEHGCGSPLPRRLGERAHRRLRHALLVRREGRDDCRPAPASASTSTSAASRAGVASASGCSRHRCPMPEISASRGRRRSCWSATGR